LLKSVFSESSTFSKTIFHFLVRFPVILLSDQGAHCRRTGNYGRSNEKIEDFFLKMYCSQNKLTLALVSKLDFCPQLSKFYEKKFFSFPCDEKGSFFPKIMKKIKKINK